MLPSLTLKPLTFLYGFFGLHPHGFPHGRVLTNFRIHTFHTHGLYYTRRVWSTVIILLPFSYGLYFSCAWFLSHYILAASGVRRLQT